jgi:hypothetical protein
MIPTYECSIREILITRDKMIPHEADELIYEALEDLKHQVKMGTLDCQFCEDWFGIIESDYLFELLKIIKARF